VFWIDSPFSLFFSFFMMNLFSIASWVLNSMNVLSRLCRRVSRSTSFEKLVDFSCNIKVCSLDFGLNTVDSRYFYFCYNEILLITVPNLYPNHSQTIEIQTGYIDSLVILIHFPYPISIVITRVYCILYVRKGKFGLEEQSAIHV
jgi:hypothetical protein